MRPFLPALSKPRRAPVEIPETTGAIELTETEREGVRIYDARDLATNHGVGEGGTITEWPEKYGKEPLFGLEGTLQGGVMRSNPCVEVGSELRARITAFKQSYDTNLFFIWRWAAPDGQVNDFHWYYGNGYGDEYYIDYQGDGQWYQHYSGKYYNGSNTLSSELYPSPDRTQLMRHECSDNNSTWKVFDGATLVGEGDWRSSSGILENDNFHLNRSEEAEMQIGLLVITSTSNPLPKSVADEITKDFFNNWSETGSMVANWTDPAADYDHLSSQTVATVRTVADLSATSNGILHEAGGSGRGLALAVDSTELHFLCGDGSAADYADSRARISVPMPTGNGIEIKWRASSEEGAARLFIDGEEVGADTFEAESLAGSNLGGILGVHGDNVRALPAAVTTESVTDVGVSACEIYWK